MQPSTMMLDSTLDKILTARHVDERLGQNDIDNSHKRDEDSEGNQTTQSEAEVRLVVRFIVEEQVVFNGKIERVNQLESEELSRVVSRVAWDGATDSNDPTPDGENSLAREKASIELDEKPPQSKPQIQASSSTTSTSTSSAAALNQPTGNSSALSGDRQAESVHDRPSNSENSSDHQACIKLYPKISELADGCEDLVAQAERHPTPEKSVTKKDCDINSERPVNNICETDHQCLQISPTIQESSTQDSKECEEIDLNPNLISSDQIGGPQTNDTLTESQSVAEALDECVNNVDLESRQADEYNSTIGAQIQNDRPRDLSLTCKQHSVLDIDVTTDRTETRLKSPMKDVDEKQKNTNFEINEGLKNREKLFKENPIETKDQLKQSYDSTNIPSREITNKIESIGSSSIKRKTTGEHSSTGKRIRRMTSKDQRDQAVRNSASKVSENSPTQQTAATNKIDPGPLSASNQHIRQNKVFAKWSDNHFYPGTILKLTRDRKFQIGFFDGAQRSVPETDIIPLRNIEGRQVRMSIAKNYCVNAVVHNLLSPVSDQPMFDVEYQHDGSVRKCVPLKDIFLTGEQGTPLISQPDKNSGISNFADVDLDNIIYEKRSRRLQEMGDFELTENTSSGSKRKRGQYGMRNVTPRFKSNNACSNSPTSIQKKSQDEGNQDSESVGSPDALKANFLCPNSNPPSESSSSTGSSNVTNVLELNQEFYFSSSSPHRTKTSLLL